MSKFQVSDLGDSQRAKLEAVLERSATDPAFREKVMHDPHGAILEETGEEIPEEVSIKFFDVQEYDFAFILPDPVEEIELSEEDLEYAAGGATSEAESDCTVDDNCGQDNTLIQY